jgi:TonB family protein
MVMALRTLVFSSDASATQLVAQHLLEFDLEPIVCHDIFSALENLGRNRFDGILVDWSDDPESSFLITRVKETELNRRATLLAIVRSQGEAARATDMGAKAVLFRPLSSGEIREALTIARPFMFERAAVAGMNPEFSSAASQSSSAMKPQDIAQDVMPIAGPMAAPVAKKREARPFAGFTTSYQPFLSEGKRRNIPVLILAAVILVAAVPLLLRHADNLVPSGTKAGSKVREIVNKVVLPHEDVPIPPKDSSLDDPSATSPSGHVRVVTSVGIIYETAARLPMRHEAMPDFPLAASRPDPPPPPPPKHVQIPDSIRESPAVEIAHAPGAQLSRVSLATSAEPVTISEELARRLLLHGSEPAYPKEARLSGLQGSVMIQAIIGRDGIVREAHLMGGYFVLGRAAFEAVRQWRFRPYVINGAAVDTRTVLTFTFELPSISGAGASTGAQ